FALIHSRWTRRVTLLKRALSEIGIDPRRVHLEWISANEGAKFQRTVSWYVNEIKRLGPSPVAEVVDGQA
ncbi:hypothetical protein DRJ24_05030, partial [Candidatus Acetothermia bacterium]